MGRWALTEHMRLPSADLLLPQTVRECDLEQPLHFPWGSLSTSKTSVLPHEPRCLPSDVFSADCHPMTSSFPSLPIQRILVFEWLAAFLRTRGEVTKLKEVQRVTTRLVEELGMVRHEGRLKVAKLFSDVYHSAWGGSICIWCIIQQELDRICQTNSHFASTAKQKALLRTKSWSQPKCHKMLVTPQLKKP